MAQPESDPPQAAVISADRGLRARCSRLFVLPRRVLAVAVTLIAGAAALHVGNMAANGAGGVGADTPTDRQPDVLAAYSVRPDLAAEAFNVRVRLHGMPGDTLLFCFPVWAPGAYDLVTFGRYVRSFQATTASGATLPVIRRDTSTYAIVAGGQDVVVQYTIADIETPPNSVWFCTTDIERSYVFANGAAVLGYVAGFKNVPCTIAYDVPNGMSIAVALDSVAPDQRLEHDQVVRHFYGAPGYDQLVDAPVQMGHWQRADFEVDGVPHTITVTTLSGTDTVDMAEMVATTRRIVRTVSGFHGGIPYRRYIFQHYIADMSEVKFQNSFGALEHAASSSYLASAPLRSRYAQEIGSTVAHEYFHVWSPKRSHSNVLGPFDYQHAPRTTSLWFAEGLTEYYSRVLMLRSGLWNSRRFMREMESDFEGRVGVPQAKSIEEISRDISSLPLDESSEALYGRGPVIGLLLDIAIRSRTGNRMSLDNAMRYIDRHYGDSGKSFADDELFGIIEQATGANLAEFHRRFIAGHEPLPIVEYMRIAGMAYDPVPTRTAVFDAVLRRGDSGLQVVSVAPGGSADSSGLRPGDLITTVEFRTGARYEATEFPVDVYGADFLATLPMGAYEVLRNGQKQRLTARTVYRMEPRRVLIVDTGAGSSARAIRTEIFGE